MKQPKPILHNRDHEHGGADTVRILWTDEPDDGTGVTYTEQLDLDFSWTNYPRAWHVQVPYLSSVSSDGGFTLDSGGGLLTCAIAGIWTITFDYTITHTGTLVPTEVQMQLQQSSVVSYFDLVGATSFVHTSVFAIGDQISMRGRHQGGGDPADDVFDDTTTCAGTLVLTA